MYTARARLAAGLGAQLLAAFGATAAQDGAATGGSHAGAETMRTGTPPVSGLGMYDAQPVPAIIPAGSLPPGAATSPAMTPPVPAAPAVAPAPAAAPLPAGGPADVYSPQTVPGTPLPPLPGSAAAQPMPNFPGMQGTAAMAGTQNGMTARSGG